MKNLIKELMKREGGKSNLKIGDCREVLKHLAQMICDQDTASYMKEFETYLSQTMSKSMKKRYLKPFDVNCFIAFRAVDHKKKSVKKKAVKKAGRRG